MIQLPADPGKARLLFQEFELKETDLILLPLSVEAGLEAAWRPDGSRTPIVVIAANALGDANSQVLAALAKIARNLEGQLLRAGMEEWADKVLSWEENLMSISY